MWENPVWGKCTPTLQTHASMQSPDFFRGDNAYHLYTLV